MSKPERTKLGPLIDVLTDYHANGSYESLKEVVRIKREKDYAIMIRTLNFERNDFKEDLIYLSEHEYNFLSKSKVYSHDILINKIANPGNVYLMPELDYPVSCGMNLFLVRFNKNVNQLYMYYCMKNAEAYIKSLAHGTATKTITKDDIRDIALPIHTDRLEQDKIAGILHGLDKLIFNNDMLSQELQRLLKTIYEYWFVQFDFPNADGKPYKATGGEFVWNDQLKRNIPNGWKVQSLAKNDLSSIIKPGVERFQSKTYLATADVNYLSIGDGSTIEYDTREGRANMQPTLFSVWFAKMKGSIKHLLLNPEMEGLIDTCILSTGFCGMQCTETSFEYVGSYVLSKWFEDRKDSLSHGATMAGINNNDLANMLIIIPDDTTLSNYHELIQPIFSLLSKKVCENRELRKTRDWLLPMLMNGQATVE